jgi:hypothetical protein
MLATTARVVLLFSCGFECGRGRGRELTVGNTGPRAGTGARGASSALQLVAPATAERGFWRLRGPWSTLAGRRRPWIISVPARRMASRRTDLAPNQSGDESRAADLLGVVRALGLTAAGATATVLEEEPSKRSRCAESVSTVRSNTPGLTGMHSLLLRAV